MQAQNNLPSPRKRGRPKDPQVEAKTLRAAAQVYGRYGWSGFNFDAVAREAGVGKSTLYARWGDAGELLCFLIADRWQALEAINTGTLEGDLMAFGCFVLSRYRETGGGIAGHLRRDIATFPELAVKLGLVIEHTTSMCRDLLRRAQQRGELREGVSLSLATDLVTSALETYAGRAPPTDAATMAAADEAHVIKVMQMLRLGIEAPRQ